MVNLVASTLLLVYSFAKAQIVPDSVSESDQAADNKAVYQRSPKGKFLLIKADIKGDDDDDVSFLDALMPTKKTKIILASGLPFGMPPMLPPGPMFMPMLSGPRFSFPPPPPSIYAPSSDLIMPPPPPPPMPSNLPSAQDLDFNPSGPMPDFDLMGPGSDSGSEGFTGSNKPPPFFVDDTRTESNVGSGGDMPMSSSETSRFKLGGGGSKTVQQSTSIVEKIILPGMSSASKGFGRFGHKLGGMKFVMDSGKFNPSDFMFKDYPTFSMDLLGMSSAKKGPKMMSPSKLISSTSGPAPQATTASLMSSNDRMMGQGSSNPSNNQNQQGSNAGQQQQQGPTPSNSSSKQQQYAKIIELIPDPEPPGCSCDPFTLRTHWARENRCVVVKRCAAHHQQHMQGPQVMNINV